MMGEAARVSVEAKEDAAFPSLYNRSFWSKDFGPTRRLSLQTYLLPVLYTSLLMWACLSFYWGSLLPNNNLTKLTVYAVDLDGGFLGKQVIAGIQDSIAETPNHLKWHFDGTITTDAASRELVTQEHAWGIVQVSANASSALDIALSDGSSSYNPLSAVSIYFLSARNQITANSKVVPSLLATVNPLLSKANAVHTAQFIAANAGNETALRIAGKCPQCLAGPFGAAQTDLRPFDAPTAIGTTMVGLIFLLTFAFSIFQIIHTNGVILGREIKIRDAMILRVVSAFVAYLLLSLWYTLIQLSFGVPMTRYFGRGGVVLFWALNWCTMAAVGIPMESIFTLLGLKWAGYFLSFWIIFNVCGGLTSFELMPGFYSYGYATPFWNSIQGARTIIFGTKNHLGLNFGVLIAWIAVGLAGMLPLTWWTLRRNQRSGTHEVA